MVYYHRTKCPICGYPGMWTTNECKEEVERMLYKLRTFPDNIVTSDDVEYREIRIEEHSFQTDLYLESHERDLNDQNRKKKHSPEYYYIPGDFSCQTDSLNKKIYIVYSFPSKYFNEPLLYPDVYKTNPKGIICPNCNNLVKYLEQIYDENRVLVSKSFDEQLASYFLDEKKQEIEENRVCILENIEIKKIQNQEISIHDYLENLVKVANDIMFLESDICLLYSCYSKCKTQLWKIKNMDSELPKKESEYIKKLENQIETIRLEKDKLRQMSDDDKAKIIQKAGLKKPIEPIKPLKPLKPNQPEYKTIEEKYLVKPDEPNYQKAGLFNKKKVEAENKVKKELYENNLKRYEEEKEKEADNLKVQKLYDEELSAYNALLAEYEEAYENYKKERDKYLDANSAYIQETKRIVNDAVNEKIMNKEPELTKKMEILRLELKQARDDKQAGTLADTVLMENKEYREQKYSMYFYESEMNKVSMKLKEQYEVLQEILSAHIIYEKYNDIVAWNTFYEYFVTGRVKEFSGPDGAYNLYESEKRANIIISKLDDILIKMEEIKENQYTLYRAVKENTEVLEDIKNELGTISKRTAKISMNLEKIDQQGAYTNKILDKIYDMEAVIGYRTLMTQKYAQITANSVKALTFMKILFG